MRYVNEKNKNKNNLHPPVPPHSSICVAAVIGFFSYQIEISENCTFRLKALSE